MYENKKRSYKNNNIQQLGDPSRWKAFPLPKKHVAIARGRYWTGQSLGFLVCRFYEVETY
jgi:hypothetical protein